MLYGPIMFGCRKGFLMVRRQVASDQGGTEQDNACGDQRRHAHRIDKRGTGSQS
jgi:hypothetical protein